MDPLSMADFYPDQHQTPKSKSNKSKTSQNITKFSARERDDTEQIKFNPRELSDIEQIKLCLEIGLTYGQIAEKISHPREVVSRKIEKWMRTVDFDDWINRRWLKLALELSENPQTKVDAFRQLTRLKCLKEIRQTKIDLRSSVTEKVDVNLRSRSVKVELAQYEALIRETEFHT